MFKNRKAAQKAALNCTRSGNRTRTTVRSQDFKSCVSTSSTIPATLATTNIEKAKPFSTIIAI